jgi:ribosome-associated protein
MRLTNIVNQCNLSGRSLGGCPVFFEIYVKDSRLAKIPNEQAREFSLAAAKIAVDTHCTDVVVLDLQGMSPATDFFVVATGRSGRQRRTVCDDVSLAAREQGFPKYGRAGYEQAKWILLDFVDVVFHIFDEESREYYDLENLWPDAKQLDVPQASEPSEDNTEPATQDFEDLSD